ncbi:MAG TPA: protein translocase subunit SecF [Halomonas sp.]|jgi:preprotein translocase subunit SecF|uniref:Protein-export membrane protein SecF n=1 Tax=Vreelandella aquamarina TaxID=77097 RepID=A0A0D7UYT7_9GAMM|nr:MULTISPECIES: protein translocase subunit SecF [Halomonas]KTG22626.1 preprotein translocase subunit SecF [Idiomarina sp. H105]MEC8901995.1 protein translocase subunit SecF [Pseudomonadota bacterium]OAF13534.1 preprotein translocase subunit SecF [Idiomarina sp. WRN-38]KJD19809.1 preprotein translocase subunit SecF [Halomonas meridiana]MCD1650828.1 protein translocase subunit SecF [Halomonas axialensis]|tara:strand:- start:3719 stop:4645 length:927 start_codon:yes stop_codon:yes gene_type:complete
MKPLSQLRIDFMGRRNLAFIVSAVMLIVSIGAIVFQQLNLGLDFTGGTLIEVRYGAAPSLDAIRQLLENSGFQDVSVQTFGASTEVLIRLQQAFDGDVGNEVVKLLRANGDSVNLVRAEFVGAQVGDQLRDQSGLGLLVALGVVMLYVALRFQYKFAIGALLALLHDVIIVVGVFALFQLDFDLTVLAAILAVIGYSLNDTIVVYDRIRETIRTSRIDDMPQIFNEAINATLSRTLATSGTTVLVLLALLLLGGDMIENFAIALLVGIVVGTFSSIYISGALLIPLKLSREDLIPTKKEVDEEEEELP